MRTSPHLPPFNAGVFLIVLFTGIIAQADDAPIVPSRSIQRAVIDAPLDAREWPATRHGFVFENSRGFDSSNGRNLVMTDASFQVDSEARISLPITFALDSSTELTGNSGGQLEALAAALRAAPKGQRFLIEGHTCVKGETAHNNRLSIARANFVVDYLVRHGISASALEALGYGPAEAVKNHVSVSDGEAVLAPYRKVMIHRLFDPKPR